MSVELGTLGWITGNPQQKRLVTPYSDGLAGFQEFLALGDDKMKIGRAHV